MCYFVNFHCCRWKNSLQYESGQKAWCNVTKRDWPTLQFFKIWMFPWCFVQKTFKQQLVPARILCQSTMEANEIKLYSGQMYWFALMNVILTSTEAQGVINSRTGVEQDIKGKRQIWLCKDSKQIAKILRKQEPSGLKNLIFNPIPDILKH